MSPQEIEAVKSLLADRSPRAIRAICVEALRRWHQTEGRGLRVATMHGALGLYAVRLMLEDRPNPSVNPIVAKEAFLGDQQLPFMAPVIDFVWWMIRTGLAWPELFPIPQGTVGHAPGNQLVSLHLTDDGLRFLDSADDHPLAPGFLKRLRARHPEVPDAVMVLLEDAQACLDVSLYRPAVVLLGLAYETAVEGVLLDLATKALTTTKSIQTANAGDRIAMLKKLLTRLQLKDEERRKGEDAIAFANHIRERRNDAAHTTPKWPFDDSDEIEELLTSAARHLPTLLDLATRPAGEA